VNKWSDRKTENKEYNGFFFCLKKSLQASKQLFVKGRASHSLMLYTRKLWSLCSGVRDSPEILKCGAVDRYSLDLACEMLLFFQVAILL
jgi:hypothetical protein